MYSMKSHHTAHQSYTHIYIYTYIRALRTTAARTHTHTRPQTLRMMTTAVCFDFDGTLGDTETPAMEVAFWEVAAYLPDLPLGIYICVCVSVCLF